MTSASSSTAHTAGGSASARHAAGSSAADRPGPGRRDPTDLFSSLLGLVCVNESESLAIQESMGDPSSAMAFDTTAPRKGQRPLKDDPLNTDFSNAALQPASNPLADLLGWQPAPTSFSAPAGDATQDSARATGRAALDDPATGNPLLSGEGPLSAQGSPTLSAPSNALDAANAVATTTPGAASGTQGFELPGLAQAQTNAADPQVLAGAAAGAQALSNGEAWRQSPVPQAPAAPAMPSAQTQAQGTTPFTASAVATGAPSGTNSPVPDSQPASAIAPATAATAPVESPLVPPPWRSTATLGGTRTMASAPYASLQSHTAALQAAHGNVIQQAQEMAAGAPAARSTVAFDQRRIGASAEAASNGIPEPLQAASPSHAQRGDASAQERGGEGGAFAMNTAENNDTNPSETAFSLEASVAPEDDLDPNTQLNLDQLRHANVRVEGDNEDAIDIRLTLAGDEVSVNFLSDSAEMRASLQHNASDHLQERLERGGLNLNEVSVSAQSQQGSGSGSGASGHPGQPPTTGSRPGLDDRAKSAGSGDVGSPQAGRGLVGKSPRGGGGPALDVFA